MSRSVDVLAVMLDAWMNVRGDELLEARAAVAELIGALDVAAYGEYLPETVEQDIRAALARVNGGAL